MLHRFPAAENLPLSEVVHDDVRNPDGVRIPPDRRARYFASSYRYSTNDITAPS